MADVLRRTAVMCRHNSGKTPGAGINFASLMSRQPPSPPSALTNALLLEQELQSIVYIILPIETFSQPLILHWSEWCSIALYAPGSDDATSPCAVALHTPHSIIPGVSRTEAGATGPLSPLSPHCPSRRLRSAGAEYLAHTGNSGAWGAVPDEVIRGVQIAYLGIEDLRLRGNRLTMRLDFHSVALVRLAGRR